MNSEKEARHTVKQKGPTCALDPLHSIIMCVLWTWLQYFFYGNPHQQYSPTGPVHLCSEAICSAARLKCKIYPKSFISLKAQHSLIRNMISTVSPYLYGSCKLIRKQQASLHDPDNVTLLIKRCHTVRSQFADELNQDIFFQGRTIPAFLIDIQDKNKAVSVYMRQIQELCSPCRYLIRCSVFLCLSSSVFCGICLSISILPLFSTRGPQRWLQRAKFEVSFDSISPLCSLVLS